MMQGATFVFTAVVVNAFMVLVTSTNPVVQMEQNNALADLLEDDYLVPVKKNASRPARQRETNFWVGVTGAPQPSLTTHNIHDTEFEVVDDFLLETEVLSRDKRQAGSGDTGAVEASLTIDEEFTAASANQASRTAAVQSQLQTELTNTDISVASTTVSTISEVDGQTMYRFSVTFNGATDRTGVAYVLMLLKRRGLFSGFNIVGNPTVQNAANVETNAICLLCPADRPCSDGACGAPSTESSSQLFAYGLSMVDNRLRHTRWDVTSDAISIQDGFPFLGGTEENFYVGDNGGVSFGAQYNPYVLSSMGRAEAKYVCIYCDDFDIRFGGDVFYHVYASGEDDADVMLDRATAEVRERTSNSGFRASWAAVITWYNVAEFVAYSATASIANVSLNFVGITKQQGNKYNDVDPGACAKRNTFQLVMMTDGQVSYIMYFFSDIQASTDFRELAVHGYKGASEFVDLQYSRKEPQPGDNEVARFEKEPMSAVVGNSLEQTGVWLFKVGEIVNLSPSRLCINWYRENRPSRLFYRFRAAALGINRCPCRRSLLRFSARFLPLPPNNGQDVYCVESQASSRDDTFECCYNRRGRFINQFPDAGSYNFISKSKSPLVHQMTDADPKDWCCRQSALCSLYASVRPKSRCYGRAPRARLFFVFGDPHFMSLDGRVFTFNGLGEFKLIELQPAGQNFTFKLQCRTTQAISGTGEKVNASLFAAFAAEQKSDTLGTGKIHVGLNKDKTRFELYINEVDVTRQFYDEANFTRRSPHLIATKQSDTRAEFSFPKIGVVVAMTIISGTLSQATVLQETYKGLPTGLLGDFNGDDTDDYKFPNGTMLTHTSTDEQLFPFGESWALTSIEDSILFYKPGQTIMTFRDPSFIPLFDKDISDADRQAGIAKCGGADKTQCIFDYALTKNDALANAATSQLEEAKSATENLSNRSPTIDGTTRIDVELGKMVTLKFNATDEDSDPITYIAVNQASGLTLNADTGTATFTPTGSDPVSISVAAQDSKNAQSPSIDVEVRLCTGCGANGQCDFANPETRPTSQNASRFQVASCKCNTGYSGATCSDDKNGCINPNPCGSLRTCTDVNATEEVRTGQAFTCSECPSGFSSQSPGENAECKNINECLTNNGNCTANSRCVDSIGSFTCPCVDGFRKNSNGQCIDIDECDESRHNCSQICNNIDGSWNCSCFTGYTLNADGATCDGSNPACTALGCEHFCDGGVCKCRTGYALHSNGTSCIDINECNNNLCSQNCNNTEGSYVCSCNAGFKLSTDGQSCLTCGFPKYGEECQSTCACQGRASGCHPARGCLCNSGWRGPTCGEDVNECEENPAICGNTQTCSNTNGSYECVCSSGYSKNGTECIDINECQSTTSTNVCPANSNCVNAIGSFACNCIPGYQKVDGNCTDINECSASQAMCGQSCANVEGSYNCFCLAGYTLNDDRTTCTRDPEQADPCAGLTSLNCSHFCQLVDGAAVCQCNRGFVLGTDKMTCIDYNECENSTLNQCTDPSTCTNTDGSYRCTCTSGTKLGNDERTCIACDDNHWGPNCANECGCAPIGTHACSKTIGCTCKSGWTGDKCEIDINECSTATCQANSDCQNTPGSYRCNCRPGYIANGNVCDDVNECLKTEDNVCDQNCDNTVGSYTCSCRTGFVLQGRGACADINECTTGNSGCPQLCRNTLGGFACECFEGYELTADRLNCTLKPGAPTCNRTDCSADGGCRVQGGMDICFCNSGYQLNADNKTCDDINECDVNTTCSQNCTNTPSGSYTCSCEDGYMLASDRTSCAACTEGTYGANCAQNCSCDASNAISCNSTDGSCTCRSGWRGATCTEDIPECTDTPNICGTNGVCNERNGTYACTCEPGFIRAGEACTGCSSTKFGDACGRTCTCVFANTASCNSVNGSCTCNEGWMGTNCDVNVNECSVNASICIGANEMCRDTNGSFACDCQVGFKKPTESNQCDPCPNPTFGENCATTCTCIPGNTASCNSVNGSCTCNSGWNGDNCEVNINECSVNASLCSGTEEVCRDTNGSYVCDCNPGFVKPSSGGACAACNSTSYGTNCENACTCVSGQFDSCNPVNGSCTCNSGWNGDNCETNVNECSVNASLCSGTEEVCRDTNGSYVCDCNPGFVRPTSGAACAACNSTSYGTNCANACTCVSGQFDSCNPVNGSCTCTSAWTGTNCETNVNECSVNASLCSGTEEVCRDTNGSYVCDCNPGFVRPSSGGACAACNSTSYGTNCANACTCVSGHFDSCNSVNGSCTCTSAWTGTNCETNVNECSVNASLCSGTEEVCRDTNGSYVCDCNPGFGRPTSGAACAACNSTSYGTNCENPCACITGHFDSCNSVNGSCTCTAAWNGTNCETNVNECAASPSPCTGSQEVCRDVIGSFQCDCNTGYGRVSAASPCVPARGFSTVIVLNINYASIINDFASAAYTALQEAIADAIDALIRAVSGVAHIRPVVGNLRIGSTVVPVVLNIDVTKTSNYDGLLAAVLEKLATTGSININGTAAPISKIQFGNKEITKGQSVCDVYAFIKDLASNEDCQLNNGVPVTRTLPGGSNVEVNTVVTLDANRDAILANTSSSAYFKLHQDIGKEIDSIISVVSPDTHVKTFVGNLSKGSVIAPIAIRIDSSKTDNTDGVLAAMLEKLIEVGQITLDNNTVPISKLVYNNTEVTKSQTVCDVFKMIRQLESNEYCELNNGIPVSRKLPEDSVNIPLAVGLSVPLFIILVLVIAGVVYLCCLKNRKRSSAKPPSVERDDDAFRSAFVGNLPTKGNLGAARYMMYSPHTLSETASQVSDGSLRNGRHVKNVGPRDYYDTPWSNERYQGVTEGTRYHGTRGEPTSNFSWENLFSTIDPHRNRQFEVPRPQINPSPNKPFRDSWA